MKTAVESGDRDQLRKIFGPEVESLLQSGDEIADKHELELVKNLFRQGFEVSPASIPGRPRQTVAVLALGTSRWLFPIPLLEENGRWRFDTTVGKEEILNRRIGENEITVLLLCREYADAQEEYRLRAGNGREYAMKFVSSPGRRDGLYWDSATGAPLSPMGPLVAMATEEGYQLPHAGKKPEPFYGYYFRILKRQGKNARFGSRNYVKDGKMTDGFAMIAYPANWGNSGIMTFQVGPDGTVYEKDLGRKTTEIAANIAQFDPDAGWNPA